MSKQLEMQFKYGNIEATRKSGLKTDLLGDLQNIRDVAQNNHQSRNVSRPRFLRSSHTAEAPNKRFLAVRDRL
jgi:hypothetical protein